MSLSQELIARVLVAERAKLLAYVWAIVRDHHVAEDIFQDVLVSALQNSDQINDVEHLQPWSRQVARHRSIDYLRSQRKQKVRLDDDVLEMLDTQWSEHDRSSAKNHADSLRHCLKELSPSAREMIELRYVHGLSGTEVAKKLERPVKSIYTTISRLYRKLDECIRRRLAKQEEI